MTHHENLKILAFVGLPGSGKSTAIDYLSEKGYPKVYFGGVVFEAMKEEGIEITPDSERAFRVSFREEHGKEVVVNRIIEQIQHLADAGQHRIIADGLYTWTEYKVLKKAFPGELIVISIVAPRHVRYHRLEKRPIRPFTPAQAYDRDVHEIENIEKAGPIAIADHFIINDDSINSLDTQLDELLREIEF